MIEIIIIRHGQSVADIEKRCEGRADFPLTELGREQAQKAANWISSIWCPDYLISSPLKRAAQTAEYIAKATGIGINFDSDLMEMDNGLVAGLLKTEADIKYPLPKGGLKSFEPRGITGESSVMLRARAETFLGKLFQELEVRDSYRRICIVSHGHMISMLFRSFLNLPLDTSVSFKTGDTGIHLWKIQGCDRRIVFTNSQEHLKL